MASPANVIFLYSAVILIVQSAELKTEYESALILHQCSISRSNLCYAAFHQSVSYDTANTTCQKYGSKLAYIKDQETQNFINQHFLNMLNCYPRHSHHTDCHVWFDLFSTSRYLKQFFISDGTSATFVNWAYRQPDFDSRSGSSHEKSCGTFSGTTGDWYDDKCQESRNYFLCQRKLPPCNTEDVHIPNAMFDSCFLNKTVPTGTVLTIECYEGFDLRGNENVTCRNGSWIQTPSCVKVCSPPILPSHADLIHSQGVKEFYDIGETTAVLCHPGYVLETDPERSHFVITCTESAVWENFPQCVQTGRLRIVNVGLKYNAEITLECQMSSQQDVAVHSRTSEEWLWQKNSLAINTQDGYIIDANGTLRIDNFQRFHEGIYTCFALSPETLVSSISYSLRLQPICTNLTDSAVQRMVVEGNSVILACPHARVEEPIQSVKWMKEGEPLSQSQRVLVVPDGSLFISKVLFLDDGEYTCEVTWSSGLCTSQLSTQLVVDASAESVCGNPLKITSSPWTVALYLDDEKTPFCYGSLIHEKWVLTSAYCLFGFYRKRSFKMYVHFGEELLESDELPNGSNGTDAKHKIRYVESIKVHPQYSPRLFANDVGLVKLKEGIRFSEDILPICLTDEDLTVTRPCDVNATIEGTVSGWGYLEMDNVDVVRIRTENMSVVDPKLCQEAATAMKQTDAVFCANHIKSEEVTYAANVGSPFVIKKGTRVYLLGTFILGERYSQLGEYDYFTKIPKYVSWIKTMIT